MHHIGVLTIILILGASNLLNAQNIFTNPGLDESGTLCQGNNGQANVAPTGWMKTSTPDRSTETERSWNTTMASRTGSPSGGCYYGFRALGGGAEGISQVVNLIAGMEYRFSFDYLIETAPSSSACTPQLQIRLDGLTVANVSAPPMESVWTRPEVTFTSPGSGNFTFEFFSGGSCSTTWNFVDGLELILCDTGEDAPILSGGTSITNACPVTSIDLTDLEPATNAPGAAGVVISYHTSSTPSSANMIADPTSVSAGTYFAAFYDATHDCFSPTTQITASTVICCIADAGTFTDPLLETFMSDDIVMVNHNGDQETSTGYTQQYFLTNEHGYISNIASSPNFGNLPQGDYLIYGINYDTGGVNNLGIGVQASSLSGSCFQLINKPVEVIKEICNAKITASSN